MVRDFNARLKNWTCEMTIIDVMKSLCHQISVYVSYANNYDTIINTLDKLVTDNPKFRAFLLNVDRTSNTNMLTYV